MPTELDVIIRRLGLRLELTRRMQKRSRQEVAEHLGVNKQTLGNYAHGRSSMTIPRLIVLCRLLKLEPGRTLQEACMDPPLPTKARIRTVKDPTADHLIDPCGV
ncbi:Helix-turn-helix domain-containing protein [Amycolatopsis arida]|uniref:Helix-turn-helix domain-containing protein n=1 Tax=Amycolatopsis arida TaxID=587909 RepID=A0A1I5K9N4_9PSEU|nr:helix-turn-helix transcriptional regulator [Amycolatopsis arida]TDX96952.1 helix-turn-helix protein [Amycolatopsis arida]SFO81774.1 Helix-turn-helix domain-containing protein [Amycolatopsis arida]